MINIGAVRKIFNFFLIFSTHHLCVRHLIRHNEYNCLQFISDWINPRKEKFLVGSVIWKKFFHKHFSENNVYTVSTEWIFNFIQGYDEFICIILPPIIGQAFEDIFTQTWPDTIELIRLNRYGQIIKNIYQ